MKKLNGVVSLKKGFLRKKLASFIVKKTINNFFVTLIYRNKVIFSCSIGFFFTSRQKYSKFNRFSFGEFVGRYIRINGYDFINYIPKNRVRYFDLYFLKGLKSSGLKVLFIKISFYDQV